MRFARTGGEWLQQIEELGRVHRLSRLLPRVDIGVRGALDVRVEPRADPLAVVHEQAAEALDADSLHETECAFQVLCMLAIVLDESSHDPQHVIVRLDDAENVTLANARAGGT